MAMANSRVLDLTIRTFAAAIAIFNVASLLGIEFSKPVRHIGEAFTTLFLIGLLLLASTSQAKITPQRD